MINAPTGTLSTYFPINAHTPISHGSPEEREAGQEQNNLNYLDRMGVYRNASTIRQVGLQSQNIQSKITQNANTVTVLEEIDSILADLGKLAEIGDSDQVRKASEALVGQLREKTENMNFEGSLSKILTDGISFEKPENLPIVKELIVSARSEISEQIALINAENTELTESITSLINNSKVFSDNQPDLSKAIESVNYLIEEVNSGRQILSHRFGNTIRGFFYRLDNI